MVSGERGYTGGDLQSHMSTDRGQPEAIGLTAATVNAEALMARYQSGDPVAVTALIHHLSPPLHRYFRADFVSRPHAEDLLQETWLRIHRVRQTYRPGEPLLPWVYAIARHVRIDHYRRASRTSARESKLTDLARLDETASAEEAQLEELDSLLAPLPASQREVLEMLKVSGMSLEEVARATSSTVGSVKQRVHRAYKKLRESIRALGPGNPGKGGVR